MIKYIFFDFDGTISDARNITYSSMIKTLDRCDYVFSKSKLKKLMGIKTEEILKNLNISRRNVRKVKKLFFKEAINRVNKKGLKLCADIKPLYDLKKQGIKLIVVSNSEKSFLNASIKKLGIGDLFDEVYGSQLFKTKDKILRKLFKKKKIKAKETIYVGDRFSDIDYAHKAHCIDIAIHNKCAWSSKSEILKEKPDHIIKDFKQLQNLVKKLNS